MNWQLQLNHQFNENNMLLLRVQQEYRRVQKKRRRRRSVWVRPWIERRVQLGQYTRLMEELRLEDVKAFKNFLRVEPELYEELVERVSHRIWKQDTAYRQSLRPGLKVAITMRYIASGDSYSCRSPAVLRGLPTPLSRPSSVTCELASLVDQRQRQVEWRLSPQHQDQQVEQVEEESAPSVEAGGSPLQHLPLRWSWGLSVDFWTFSLLSPWMERSSLGKDVWDPSR